MPVAIILLAAFATVSERESRLEFSLGREIPAVETSELADPSRPLLVVVAEVRSITKGIAKDQKTLARKDRRPKKDVEKGDEEAGKKAGKKAG